MPRLYPILTARRLDAPCDIPYTVSQSDCASLIGNASVWASPHGEATRWRFCAAGAANPLRRGKSNHQRMPLRDATPLLFPT